MKKVTIVGAGISGPAAARAFQRQGYEVIMREARTKVTSTSGGVLGITRRNMNLLTKELGVPYNALVRYEESKVTKYSVVCRQVARTESSIYDGHYVTWQDLHNALVAGVDVSYGDKVTEIPDGRVIWADGIGSLGRRTFDPSRRFHYAGYSVFRGIIPCDPGNNVWHSFVNPGMAVLNYGRTFFDGGIQTDWALFIPWSAEFPRHVENINDDVRGRLFEKVAMRLPARQAKLIHDTSVISASQIGDWDIPHHLNFGNHTVIGDGVATMRPHTSMGANLGITEAVSLAVRQNELGHWENAMARMIANQIMRGQRMGSALMPKSAM